MNQLSSPADGLHWRAAVVAAALAGLLLTVAQRWAVGREVACVHALAALSFPQKDQGLAWQRAAVRAADVLPLYGSSELSKPVPDKASEFFAHAPTGFIVSPVGKVGTTSLPMLQRLGALGRDLRGKPVAVSISPSWFFLEVIHPHYYEGNFSVLAADELLFGTAISLPLKRDIARRMQLFPRTFVKNPLLGLAVDSLSADAPWEHLVYFAIWPLGRLQSIILSCQDDFESVLATFQQTSVDWRPEPATPDWPTLLAAARTEASLAPPEAEKSHVVAQHSALNEGGSAGFLARMQNAHEWKDFTLLLRVLTELRARPLILSMPMNGPFFDRVGIPRAAREVYYERMRALAAQFHFPLVESENHDADPAFLEGHHDHLSAEGWMVYDEILDDFFHHRPLPE